MGRLSDIEQLKLQATFFNNLGVGMLLGGLILPYLAISPNLGTIVARISSGALGKVDTMNAIGVIVAMGLSMYGARRMRHRVRAIIDRIQD